MRKHGYRWGGCYCKACRRYLKADEVHTIPGRGKRLYCKACGNQVRLRPTTVGGSGDSQPILVLETQLLRTIDWQRVDSIAQALGAATVEVLVG